MDDAVALESRITYIFQITLNYIIRLLNIKWLKNITVGIFMYLWSDIFNCVYCIAFTIFGIVKWRRWLEESSILKYYFNGFDGLYEGRPNDLIHYLKYYSITINNSYNLNSLVKKNLILFFVSASFHCVPISNSFTKRLSNRQMVCSHILI